MALRKETIDNSLRYVNKKATPTANKIYFFQKRKRMLFLMITNINLLKSMKNSIKRQPKDLKESKEQRIVSFD